ncbi:MAG: tungstate ABC transporter substrate-binding protein WtpA [Chloroflexota bacterium]
MFSKLFRFAICFSLGLGLAACNGQPTEAESEAKTPLVVFAAGSLIIPFADLEKAFEAANPDIDVQAEYHGSIQVMRHATELHEAIDVVATADASLIPMLMYAANVPETGQPYADWHIRFASNRLALAYRAESKYAAEINAENWFEILARPDVKLGLPDPRFDAAGYRELMAFALMENSLGRYGLFEPVFNGQFTFPITVFRDDNLTTITVPEILETKPDSHIALRGGSIMLVALLESGDLDYAFEYESVIQQHGLKMLALPDAVNLGEAEFESAYKAVQVDLDFQRFATVKPQFRGERIGYGITIPADAPHPDAAALFIEFLLGPEGRAIMGANHHPLFDPCLADGYASMPPSLQAICVPVAP